MTPTAPPAAPPAPTPFRPRVAVLDGATSWSDHLRDDRWLLLTAGQQHADVAVVPVSSPDDVTAARSRCPHARLLAVLPPQADSAQAVAVLAAGAAACVRGTDPREIAAHVVALTRRLTAQPSKEPAMSTSAPERPDFSYLPGSAATTTPPAAPPTPPVQPAERRPGRRRTAALLLCGALLCSGTGAATALLVDDDAPATSAPTSAIARSSGALQPTGTTSAGTAQSAAATIAPSVVTIAVTSSASGPFGAAQTTSGTGSGIVLRSDGTILTNNHVVAGATDVTVTFDDGSTVPATVVGTDPTSDLAVVRAQGVTDLTAAVFADSDELAVGQAVLAVGAPLGLSNTVTEGIVSTLDRAVRTGDSASESSVIDAVQTDAAINPGNSGGALVDLQGRVVGVNSAIATAGDGSSGNIGVGFAIPSNDAVEVAEQLIADGTADHPLLGVSVGESTGAASTGAVLTAVTAGGPAADAGLQAGDVVTQVGDRAVVDADSLIVAVRDHEVGAEVEITYTRGGASRTTTATLSSTD